MFDIGWQELFVIAVLAIIVVGPKDLPQAMRVLAKAVRKARGLAREFQSGIDEMMREAELDEIKRQANKAAHLDLDGEMRKTVDPTGTLIEDFGPKDFRRELKERVEGGTSPRQESASARSSGTVAAEATTTAEGNSGTAASGRKTSGKRGSKGAGHNRSRPHQSAGPSVDAEEAAEEKTPTARPSN